MATDVIVVLARTVWSRCSKQPDFEDHDNFTEGVFEGALPMHDDDDSLEHRLGRLIEVHDATGVVEGPQRDVRSDRLYAGWNAACLFPHGVKRPQFVYAVGNTHIRLPMTSPMLS